MTALSAVLPTPLPVTARDRLGLTLFLAAALHAIVILGVGIEQFVLKPLRDNLPVMEITLVTRPAEKSPEQADYLAQANQDGGGNTAERVQVITTLPALTPAPQPVTEPEPATPPQQEAKPVLTKPEGKKAAKAASKPAPKAAPEPTLPSAAELVSRSLQMASLSAQISDSALAYAQRPRQTFIAALACCFFSRWRSALSGAFSIPNPLMRSCRPRNGWRRAWCIGASTRCYSPCSSAAT